LQMEYQNCEVLIPIIDEIVLDANHDEKILNVNLPVGLLEVYLDDNHQPDDED